MKQNLKKVKFVTDQGSTDVLVNDQPVGYLSGGGGECWFTVKVNGKQEFVARFKYMRPKAKAMKYAKWVLQRFTPEEIVAGTQDRNSSPLGWAESKGYQSLSEKSLAERNAMLAARRGA